MVWPPLVSSTIRWALLVSRSWILYTPCNISLGTWGATNQHVINAAQQTVEIGDTEEGSCKDTKKILVLSL